MKVHLIRLSRLITKTTGAKISPKMPIEVIIEYDAWKKHNLTCLMSRLFNHVLEHFKYDAGNFNACLLGCDDKKITALNLSFLSKKKSTNILSWPSQERRSSCPGHWPMPLNPLSDQFLGDIAISYDTCRREAHKSGKTIDSHATHLLIHSILHLMGFHHENNLDATLMENIEIEILGNLGEVNPYKNN